MEAFFKFKAVIFSLVLFIYVLPAGYAYEAFPEIFHLENLDGKNGFSINGSYSSANGYGNGYSVSKAGDINGDGIGDIIISSPYINLVTGQSYVVFGSKGPWSSSINVTNFDGNNGFTINGIPGLDDCGYSVSEAGDVNGDGIVDIILGAPLGNQGTGQSYVIFGNEGKWPANMNISELNGSNGFVINGISAGDRCGISVSGIGDVSGDGIDDMLIGAPFAGNTGQSYVVYGSKNPWSAILNLESLNGSNGFAINGINAQEGTGTFVSGIGDVNGDGIPDMSIGAIDPTGILKAYVVFGRVAPLPASSFDLSTLDGNNGFAIINFPYRVYVNDIDLTIRRLGDINGDGIDDILIGNPGRQSSYSYVIFGNKSAWPAALDLQYINGNNGFILLGVYQGDQCGMSTSGIGDMNGDGTDDILIGAYNAFSSVGESYLVFGQNGTWPKYINLNLLNGENGVTFRGINSGDFSGWSVSGAGDVNGDKIPDIVIGAPGASNTYGQTYVIFGQR